MTLNEAINKVREVFPNVQVDEDITGQIVIYTGTAVDRDENLIPFEE